MCRKNYIFGSVSSFIFLLLFFFYLYCNKVMQCRVCLLRSTFVGTICCCSNNHTQQEEEAEEREKKNRNGDHDHAGLAMRRSLSMNHTVDIHIGRISFFLFSVLFFEFSKAQQIYSNCISKCLQTISLSLSTAQHICINVSSYYVRNYSNNITL